MGMTEDEKYVREFAEAFPGDNVLLALTLCEVGILPWNVVAKLLRDSLCDAVEILVNTFSD